MSMLNAYRTPIFNLVMAVVAMLQAMGVFGTTPVPTGDQVGGAIDTVSAGIGVLWLVGNFVLQLVKRIEQKSATPPSPPSPPEEKK